MLTVPPNMLADILARRGRFMPMPGDPWATPGPSAQLPPGPAGFAQHQPDALAGGRGMDVINGAGVPGVGAFPPPRQPAPEAAPEAGPVDWSARAAAEMAPITDAISRLEMMRNQPAVRPQIDPTMLFNQPGGRRQFGMMPEQATQQQPGQEPLPNAIHPTIRNYIKGQEPSERSAEHEALRQVFARHDGTVPVRGEFIRPGNVPEGDNSTVTDSGRAQQAWLAVAQAKLDWANKLQGSAAARREQQAGRRPAMEPEIVAESPRPQPGGAVLQELAPPPFSNPRDVPAAVERDVAENANRVPIDEMTVDVLNRIKNLSTKSRGQQLLEDRARAASGGLNAAERNADYQNRLAGGEAWRHAAPGLARARDAQYERSLTPGQRLQRAIDSGGDPAFNAMVSGLSPQQQAQAWIERDRLRGEAEGRRIQEKGIDAETKGRQQEREGQAYWNVYSGHLAAGRTEAEAHALAQEAVGRMFGGVPQNAPAGTASSSIEFKQGLLDDWSVPGIEGWDRFMSRFDQNPAEAKKVMLEHFGGAAAARRAIEKLRRGHWDNVFSVDADDDNAAINQHIDRLKGALGL